MTVNDELLRIMERIADSTATEAETAKFNAWCDTFKQAQPEIQNLEEIKARVLVRIHNNIASKPKILSLYRKTIGVAAAVAVIVGVWLLVLTGVPTVDRDPQYANDVSPGKRGATLTLANGKKIDLSDAKTGNLATESGVRITRDEKGMIVYTITEPSSGASNAFNTLETSRGEQTKVRLPDGSIAYLNAASSLRYPAFFAKGKQRKVSLAGEGYFEIAKDETRPFIVESRGQQVKVLGTHFNINAYSNEPAVKTTLLEGSILISSQKTTKQLVPGDQATITGNSISVKQTDPQLSVAWKNDLFLFENEQLGTIMRQIERWYDVEVEYRDPVAGELFGGGVSRFDNVSKLLKSLEATGKVHFEIEGRKIYVSK